MHTVVGLVAVLHDAVDQLRFWLLLESGRGRENALW